ncbi:D-alanyl-D-alanine carboxypeptidase family protein [Hutsoniella sourekii]
MFKNKWMKGLLVASLAFTSLSVTVPTALATSKTPNLTADSKITQPEEPLTRPEDYPQDLVDWYDQNMDARSYVVVDNETHRILAQREGNTPYPIASMSKVVSIYMVYKAIEEGKLSLDDKITVPSEIVEYISANPNLSNVGLTTDVEYPVKDLIYGVMLASGNDATSALLWHIYGSEEAAVEAIRAQLKEWGITNFQFYTTSGAPNEELPESLWVAGSNADSENIMSAADVALMAQNTVEAYPQLLEVTSSEGYTFMEGTPYEQHLGNPNELLPGRAYGREGVTGLKSGFTDDAGKNFVATSTENGRKVVAVAMGVFGEGMSSYWEIEILLDKLEEYPELYQNENLPTNLPDPKEEAEAQEEASEESESQEQYENKRDNPVTNFFRKFF